MENEKCEICQTELMSINSRRLLDYQLCRDCYEGWHQLFADAVRIVMERAKYHWAINGRRGS